MLGPGSAWLREGGRRAGRFATGQQVFHYAFNTEFVQHGVRNAQGSRFNIVERNRRRTYFKPY